MEWAARSRSFRAEWRYHREHNSLCALWLLGDGQLRGNQKEGIAAGRVGAAPRGDE